MTYEGRFDWNPQLQKAVRVREVDEAITMIALKYCDNGDFDVRPGWDTMAKLRAIKGTLERQSKVILNS